MKIGRFEGRGYLGWGMDAEGRELSQNGSLAIGRPKIENLNYWFPVAMRLSWER